MAAVARVAHREEWLSILIALGTTVGSVASLWLAPTYQPASGLAWTLAGWFAFGYLFFQTLSCSCRRRRAKRSAFPTPSSQAFHSWRVGRRGSMAAGSPAPLALSTQRPGFPVGDDARGIFLDSVDTHRCQPSCCCCRRQMSVARSAVSADTDPSSSALARPPKRDVIDPAPGHGRCGLQMRAADLSVAGGRPCDGSRHREC